MNPVPSEPSAEPDEMPAIRRAGTPTVMLAAAVLMLSIAALFLIGWFPRHRQQMVARNDAAELTGMAPALAVAHPRASAGEGSLTLPCDVKADQEASLQTRAVGYLKALHADLGDKVEAAQLLAEIDAPDVDAELARGKAALLQAQASLDKATNTFKQAQRSQGRFGSLRDGATSAEEVDLKTWARDTAANGVAQETANVAFAEAEVKRLTALLNFGRVTAPFAGRIAARNYDIGALISPASPTVLFRLVQSDNVRVFVRVPQIYASDVGVGALVVLNVRNQPGIDFPGKITRMAGEFEVATRTMLFEARVPNPDDKLAAGMYGQLRLELTARKPVLVIPVGALLFQGEGKRVVVANDGVAHLQAVVIGRDFGTDLEVLSGLASEDWVAVSPPAQLKEGDPVKVIRRETSAEPAKAGTK